MGGLRHACNLRHKMWYPVAGRNRVRRLNRCEKLQDFNNSGLWRGYRFPGQKSTVLSVLPTSTLNTHTHTHVHTNQNTSTCVPVARAPASLLKVADLTWRADGADQISYLTLVIQTHPFSCPWGCANEAEVTGWILLMTQLTSFCFMVVNVVCLLVYL